MGHIHSRLCTCICIHPDESNESPKGQKNTRYLPIVITQRIAPADDLHVSLVGVIAIILLQTCSEREHIS